MLCCPSHAVDLTPHSRSPPSPQLPAAAPRRCTTCTPTTHLHGRTTPLRNPRAHHLAAQVGKEGVANRDVRQEVVMCKDDAAKMTWLLAKLQSLVDEGGWALGP